MNFPKIELTQDFILSQIKDVKYFYDETLTICVITTLSDFKVIGTSNVLNPLQYNRIKGMEIARQKATAILGDHCAYYLKTINSN